MISAVVALQPNEDKRIIAYGIAFYLDEEPIGIASVYLRESVGVNDGLRAAIAMVAETLRDNYYSEAVVLSREQVIRFPARRARLERDVITMKIKLQFATRRANYYEAKELAEDAAERKTTIIEIIRGN